MIIGVEGEFDHLVGGAGDDPGVLRGVGVAPVAALDNFELFPAGVGYGEIQAVDAIATDEVAVGAIIEHRVAGVVPALEATGHAPVGAAAAIGHNRDPAGVGI